jgi:hypothetical protein
MRWHGSGHQRGDTRIDPSLPSRQTRTTFATGGSAKATSGKSSYKRLRNGVTSIPASTKAALSRRAS